MKKIIAALLFVFLIIVAPVALLAAQAYDYQIIDKHTQLYFYCFQKAAALGPETAEKFAWINEYKRYFDCGALAAAGEKFELDAILKQIDIDYYYRNLSSFYYNVYQPNDNDIQSFKDNQSIRFFQELISREIDKAAILLKNGNPEASAFFLGAATKYYAGLALWPYAMGKNSPLGQAKNEVIKEYFEEINKIIESDNLYKIDSRIKFDGFKNKFDIEEAVINLVKFTALDSFNPEPYRRMNAITMYNLMPMSDSLNKKVATSKIIDSLSGVNVAYTD